MLIVETIGRIRRAHLWSGKSIRQIARDLKISRNTVRRILRSGETSFSYEREIQPRPKLGRWKAEIDRMLTKNAEASARERLTLIRLFEELRGFGYEGGGHGGAAKRLNESCLCRPWLRPRVGHVESRELSLQAYHWCGVLARANSNRAEKSANL